MIEKFTLTMDMTGGSGGFPPLTRRHQSEDVSDAYLAVDLWKNFQKHDLGEISEEKRHDNGAVDIFEQKISDNKKMIFKTPIYCAIINLLIWI
jgi:oligoribonuclease NrnB/cAMP/cGMP phosphodiesterase (DHH superfamily)